MWVARFTCAARAATRRGVVRSQVVDVPDADAMRYCTGPDAIAEPA
jgi:hypothetical protein